MVGDLGFGVGHPDTCFEPVGVFFCCGAPSVWFCFVWLLLPRGASFRPLLRQGAFCFLLLSWGEVFLLAVAAGHVLLLLLPLGGRLLSLLLLRSTQFCFVVDAGRVYFLPLQRHEQARLL